MDWKNYNYLIGSHSFGFPDCGESHNWTWSNQASWKVYVSRDVGSYRIWGILTQDSSCPHMVISSACLNAAGTAAGTLSEEEVALWCSGHRYQVWPRKVLWGEILVETKNTLWWKLQLLMRSMIPVKFSFLYTRTDLFSWLSQWCF